MFKGLPERFEVTRYHSLIVERESLPDVLEVTAETPDGIIMGLQHKTHPVHGVQFHPESIASEHGHALLANFLDACRHEPAPAQRARAARRRLKASRCPAPELKRAADQKVASGATLTRRRWRPRSSR